MLELQPGMVRLWSQNTRGADRGTLDQGQPWLHGGQPGLRETLSQDKGKKDREGSSDGRKEGLPSRLFSEGGEALSVVAAEWVGLLDH